MKPVNVCIVVFNRYDLLARLLRSIEANVLTPGREVGIYIIDRGRNELELLNAIDGLDVTIVDVPGNSLPAAWNWFAQHVPEERILASDDVEFHTDAIETFADTAGDLLGIHDGRSSPFACFSLRDSCIAQVGLFDESISPDYMYFEDSDYGYRMKLLQVPIVGVTCLTHIPCQSWVKKTTAQQNDHHPRFILAEQNYIKKWGGKPFEETFTVPYNGAAAQ